MGDGTALRQTQRAPRSCLACSSRKVKCDKAVPCANCIRRGQAHLCTRETVIVRGEVKTWTDATSTSPHRDGDSASLDELRNEVDRLKQELLSYREEHASLTAPSSIGTTEPRKKRSRRLANDDWLEDTLWSSIASATLTTRSTVLNWSDIVLPNRRCSDRLIAYDKKWNSWAHFALEYPGFEQECERFIDAFENVPTLEFRDPFWLAVYFSVLCAALSMMDDQEAEQLLPSEQLGWGVFDLSRNWYDAALFCLNRADFMRIPHIGTVQATAVLGMCFNIFGDADLGQHMRNSAIRIAQKLGIDRPCSSFKGSLSPEGQKRLWWTLVICEWLNVPYDHPQVEEEDFDLPLPSPRSLPRSGRDVDPAHYHVFMARTAQVYRRFTDSISRGATPLEEVVRSADEQLAQIIVTLPEHLQPDFADISRGGNEDDDSGTPVEPWIKWQRFDITLVLLHHRVRINRTLQRQWLENPVRFSSARVVSVRSAMDIIWISRNWDQPISMRKQWALSFHIFVAAILLLREWQHSTDQGRNYEYQEAIETAMHLLEPGEQQHAIANHALRVLQQEMQIMHTRR